MITRRTALCAASLAWLALVEPCAGESSTGGPARNAHATGVAVTPAGFPDFDAGDLDRAFDLAAEVGDYAIFIYQWGELDPRVAALMVAKSRAAGLEPMLGLSPTTLGQGRKELDLPADVRRRAAPFVSFAHPVVREAFKRSAAELAALDVPYLCLATEINLLAMQRLEEFIHFSSLYKETYAVVKRIAPDTKVFVSFQWEWMRILDAREPQRLREHSRVVDIFRPALDVVGLTTYPSAFHRHPGELPADYYTWLYHHVPRGEEIVLMEVGWPSAGSGSEAEQARYIARLPELTDTLDVSVMAWALLHDVALAEFDADLDTVGLLTREGQPKPAFAAFKRLHDGRP